MPNSRADPSHPSDSARVRLCACACSTSSTCSTCSTCGSFLVKGLTRWSNVRRCSTFDSSRPVSWSGCPTIPPWPDRWSNWSNDLTTGQNFVRWSYVMPEDGVTRPCARVDSLSLSLSFSLSLSLPPSPPSPCTCAGGACKASRLQERHTRREANAAADAAESNAHKAQERGVGWPGLVDSLDSQQSCLWVCPAACLPVCLSVCLSVWNGLRVPCMSRVEAQGIGAADAEETVPDTGTQETSTEDAGETGGCLQGPGQTI